MRSTRKAGVRRRSFKSVLLAAAIGALSGCATGQLENEANVGSGPAPLHVAGRVIVDNKGRKVVLRGVNAASLEWTSDGQQRILTTVGTAVRDWHVNVVRLPLSQDRWFGKAPGQDDEGRSYKKLVGQIVEYCSSNHCYVILDLHWSDCNEWGANLGQHSMPDGNSIVFWKGLAETFANNPAVIYDLYNEPHDVSWEVWLNGGHITDKPNNRRPTIPVSFDAVGMQQLLNTVRDTGARNLVIVGGLDWSYDYSGILEGRKLSDPKGHGVVYANHCYDNKNETVSEWEKRMNAAAAHFPIIVSEFGGRAGPSRKLPSDNWLFHLMVTLDKHHWSWVAWDMHPYAGPALISDWNYTPTQQFGVHVKKMLTENRAPIYTPPASE